MDDYIAHFHEMAEYDGLDLYWRGVTSNEVFGRLFELHHDLDLTPVKAEFISTEPSTPAEKRRYV